METDIAVVGVACRFPDAENPREFWGNLDAGTVSTRPLSEEALRAAGVSDELLRSPDYVTVGGTLADPGHFAAEFFGCPPREAELIDPAQRLFLESCWAALEAAGHPPGPGAPHTGVFAGTGPSNYSLALRVAAVREHGVAAVSDDADLYLGSEPDFLTSRVAYKLGLRGPSVSVATACTSALTAVHQATLSLLSGECDLALAGGATVIEPVTGYRYRPGGIVSADGLCRAFDARSTGTSFGSGIGVVALRRLADALADGDPVHAVLLGSAVGNDGNLRTGFTAPSPDGVASVVRAALRVAGVAGDELRYVEAHGSGTPLGDQIELRGLIDGLGATGTGFCGLGTVKANIGHCGPAAGIAGLIKAVHVVASGSLPAHPLLEHPRDAGVLADSPFRIPREREHCADPARRVLVNSMGLGGTTAAAVLAPPPAPTRPPAPAGERVRLLLSARTRGELDAMSRALADELARGDLPLADVAHTLRVGRASFAERRVVTATADQVVAALRLPRPPLVTTARTTPAGPFTGTDEDAAVRAWLGGADVDWRGLAGSHGRRITLPTYPLRRSRFWALDRLDPVAAVPAAAPARQSTSDATSDATSADELEASLLAVWRELFGVDTVGPDDEFGALGGTSLLSVRMVLEIQRRHDVLVNVHRAGGSKATVRRVADLVRRGDSGEVADGDGALADADVELPLGPVAPAAPDRADVLLTGATGFIGAFLLHELLRVPGRRVHCLVRADDESHAWQRIRTAARTYALPEPDRSRVVSVRALAEVDAQAVGHVLHCAARVVFTEPYRVLREDNVLPLVELVRWMRAAGIRDIGLVSSSAATGESLGERYRITESRQQPLDPLQGGYGVSKWVGERILERAERDGMRVRVFRPGYVLGDSTTGACNPRDFLWRLLASGLAVGAHPADDRALPMAPVDVVAAGIAELTVQPGSAGRAYHLAARTAVSPRRLFQLLGLTEAVPVERWLRLVAERALDTRHEVLSTMALYEVDGHWLGPHDLEANAWQPWLDARGLDPNPTGELLDRCLDHLAAREPAFATLLGRPVESR